MLQQSGSALQALAGVLQQFAQVQQVGQAALAIRQSQQAGRNMLLVQPAVEHGQDTLLLPLLQPALARFGQRIGHGVVLQKSL